MEAWQTRKRGIVISIPLPIWAVSLLQVGSVVALGALAGLAIVFVQPLYLLLFLVVLIGSLTLLMGWPVTAFALLAASALFTRYTVEIGQISVRAEYVAVLLIAALGAWQIVWHRRKPVVTWPGVLALGWLLVNLLASLVNAPDAGDSLQHTLRLVLVVLGFFLVINLLQKPNVWRQAYRWFLLFGIAEATFGIVARLAYPSINLGVQTARHLAAPVPYGTFEEGNLLGSHAASWLLALLFLFLAGDPRLRFRRLWVIGGMGVTGLIVAFSLSRGAWLGLATGLVLVFLYYGRERGGQARRLLYFLMLIPVAFAVLAISLSFLPESVPLIGRLRTFISISSDPTFQGRLSDIPIALEDWRQHLFLGWGPGTYYQLHGILRGSRAWLPNVTLRTLQETGVAGMVFFGGYVLTMFWMAIRTSRRAIGSDDRAMLLGLVIAFCALLVAYQATDGTWLVAPWLHGGLLVAGARALRQQETAQGERSLPRPATEAVRR